MTVMQPVVTKAMLENHHHHPRQESRLPVHINEVNAVAVEAVGKF